MRVITLGTGAGRPTLSRNTSATGLEFKGETFLFDCGEGTQVQLMRSAFHWGKLSAIFIGHMHGDHLNGLPGLLGTLSLSDRQETLKIFGPPGLKEYLRLLVECKNLWLRFPAEIQEIKEAGILLDTAEYQVETALLDHTIECWGYVFREKARRGHFNRQKAKLLGIPEGPIRARLVHGEAVTLEDGRVLKPEEFVGLPRRGRSIAYCLDTQPCENVIRLAQDVDLLIHEATFDRNLKKEANEWGHSTAADAAEAARQSGARHLLLTHISQRYPDEAILLEEATAIFPKTTVARDLGVYSVEGSSVEGTMTMEQ
jgi:ribonuclease Z